MQQTKNSFNANIFTQWILKWFLMCSHLPHVEGRLWADDGLWAELSQRHQTLDVVVEADDAAKVLDADDVAVRDAAGEGVAVAEEQPQGAVHQGLLPGQVQPLFVRVDGQHLHNTSLVRSAEFQSSLWHLVAADSPDIWSSCPPCTSSRGSSAQCRTGVSVAPGL